MAALMVVVTSVAALMMVAVDIFALVVSVSAVVSIDCPDRCLEVVQPMMVEQNLDLPMVVDSAVVEVVGSADPVVARKMTIVICILTVQNDSILLLAEIDWRSH